MSRRGQMGIVRRGARGNGGGRSIATIPPAAPTISGTVTIGGTLTITPGGGGPATSFAEYLNGVATGRSVTATGAPVSYTVVAPDITGQNIDFRAVNAAGTSGASNTVAWVGIAAALSGERFIADETNFVGSPIDNWNNQVASAYPNYDGTTTTRPATGRTINGYAAADFDGTDDVLVPHSNASLTSFGSLTAYTTWAVVLVDAVTGTSTDYRNNEQICASTTNGFAMRFGFRKNGAVYTAGTGHYDGAFKQCVDTISLGTATLLRCRYDGTNIYLQVGSNAEVSVAAGTIAGADITVKLGTRYTSTAPFFDGLLACLVASNVNEANRDDVSAYLRNKYGLA